MSGFYPYPAVIEEYLPDRRKVKVSIPSLTDGDVDFPEADIIYPIGDKQHHTELEIKKGDTVWISFIGGDMRYPIVIGWRAPEAGNAVGWRKYHHANIELSADGEIIIKGKSLKLEFDNIETTGTTTNNSPVTNKSPVTNQSTTSMVGGADNGSGGSVQFNGGINATQDITAQGVSLSGHIHTGDSGGTTSPPR